ncbi:7868_t:CDS:1, partial [Dentiscutata heterogama]
MALSSAFIGRASLEYLNTELSILCRLISTKKLSTLSQLPQM